MKKNVKSPPPRTSISIRVETKVADALKERADAEDRSVSYMAKRAIRQFVEAEEATS